MKCHQLCLLVALFQLGCRPYEVLGTQEEDSWIEPDAWSRERHLKQNADDDQSSGDTDVGFQCNAPKTAGHDGEALALIYYKRLIAYLFKSELFKHNKVNGHMSRAFILTALPEQLEQLKNLSDPRDLDIIITKILLKARVPTLDDYDSLYGNVARHGRTMGVLALIWDIIKDLGKLLKTSEVQFLLGASSFVLLGWHWHRRYGIGMLTLIIGAVVCFGYFHTYLECNRKLEAERQLEILIRNEQLQQKPRWYSPFINLFFSDEPDAKQTQRDYIKKSSQLNLNFCRPDHVFLLYANDLFLTQLQFLIDKCHETISTFRENLPFPLNYIASILLVALIAYIVKLTFKYILSPRAWAGVWHGQAPHHNTPPTIGTGTGTAHHEDRISGENLRMLLHAFSGGASSQKVTSGNTTATASLTQTPTTGSGVQEIPDAIENGSADTASDSSMSEETKASQAQNSPQQHNEKLVNNNCKEKSPDKAKDKCDVKIEELEDIIDEET